MHNYQNIMLNLQCAQQLLTSAAQINQLINS
jgi:hypothetical protein